jgi:hypothetical protein
MRKFGVIVVLAAVLAGSIAHGETSKSTSDQSNCDIKGNINGSGEHIYHMPGQSYYDRTNITPSKGERWFCSEEEARAAGWRRSKV